MPTSKPQRPTQQEIRDAYGKTVPDVIAPGLRVLFCGINPGLFSGAVGHHFARPGNRFWPTLYAAGFSDRLLSPGEERELLNVGYGITNLVERATAGADELTSQELVEGAQRLEAKVKHYRPASVAILGIGVYRRAFKQRQAKTGRQPEGIAGSELWVLPNPSGLNAHYQLEDLAHMHRELRTATDYE
jgi:TDG/mug DNA glycosylase family protein